MTVALNEAWTVFGDDEKRDAYDRLWLQRKATAQGAVALRGAADEAELRRREGNELVKAAQATLRSEGLIATATYEAAIAKYTEGLRLAPQQHLLWTNRALCFSALSNWSRCRADALQATRLQP